MKGFLAVGLAAVLLLVALFIFIVAGVGYYLSPQSPLKPSDAIVAISGGETSSRAKEAAKLYNDGWAKQVIFSGAALDPSSPSNALVMKREAEALGVPAEDITIDEKADTTSENAKNVAAIIKARGYHTIILVTSPYHQRRAYISFSRVLGKKVVILNHSAIDQNWRRSKWWANPQSFGLTMAELQKTIFLLLGGNPA